jgi:hypothetical protein
VGSSIPEAVRRPTEFYSDYRSHGERLWERFNATGDETLWYYRQLIEAFRQPDQTALVDELVRVVGELEAERSRRGTE